MIIHCVLFKLIAEDEKAKKEARDAIEAALKEVSTLKKYEAEFGPPISSKYAQGYDFALIARFPDRGALETYANDPDHEKVKENVIYPRVKRDETIDYDLEYGLQSEA